MVVDAVEVEGTVGEAIEGEVEGGSINVGSIRVVKREMVLAAVVSRTVSAEAVTKLTANASQPTLFPTITTTTRTTPARSHRTTRASHQVSSLRRSSNTHLRASSKDTTHLIPAQLRHTNNNPLPIRALRTTSSTASHFSTVPRRPRSHPLRTSNRPSSNITGRTTSSSIRSSNSSLRGRSNFPLVHMSIRHSGQASSSRHHRSMVAGERSSSNIRSIKVRAKARAKHKDSLIWRRF